MVSGNGLLAGEWREELGTAGPLARPPVIGAGSYLVEAVLSRPASPEMCSGALEKMAWSEVIVDESPRKAASTILRFVGKVPEGKSMVLSGSEALRWTYVRKLVVNPYADIRLELSPFKLITGQTSEARFLSRLGRRDLRGEMLARDVVERMLETMQFRPLKLTALRQNMRLPDRPGAGMTLWLAIVKWVGPMSVLVIQDPFYFEDLAPIRVGG